MDTFIKIMAVSIGGAFGAVSRYLISLSPITRSFDKFPLPTFVVNLLGSFLIGFCLIALTDKIQVSENLRIAIMVGFIGAFTTFATFEIEIYGLVKERFFSTALLYILLSVVLGFVGLLAGVAAAKQIN